MMRRFTGYLMLFACLASLARAASPPTPPSIAVLGGNNNLAISGTTAAIALPVSSATFPIVELLNDSPGTVFVVLGSSSGVVATTGGLPIQPGRSRALWLTNGASWVAGITSGATGLLRVVQWNGAPTYTGANDTSATALLGTINTQTQALSSTPSISSTTSITSGAAISVFAGASRNFIRLSNNNTATGSDLGCTDDGSTPTATHWNIRVFPTTFYEAMRPGFISALAIQCIGISGTVSFVGEAG